MAHKYLTTQALLTWLVYQVAIVDLIVKITICFSEIHIHLTFQCLRKPLISKYKKRSESRRQKSRKKRKRERGIQKPLRGLGF